MKQPSIATVASPGVPEIFADGAASVVIRRNVARITLVSDRVTPASPSSVERVVVGHLAMSVAGFVGLYARMASVVEQLRAAGVIAKETTGATGTAMAAPPPLPTKQAVAKKPVRKK
jgi:hypothetical protein